MHERKYENPVPSAVDVSETIPVAVVPTLVVFMYVSDAVMENFLLVLMLASAAVIWGLFWVP